MASTVRGRFWRLNPSEFRFRHTFATGFHPRYRGTTFHVNPGILWHILKQPPSLLLIGGGWHLPTAFMSALIPSMLRRGSLTILWAEANRAAMAHPDGPAAMLRRVVARKACAFAVPGRVAESTIREDWGITDRPFLLLPNLVDEQVFGGKVAQLRLRRNELRERWEVLSSDLVLLWPARLHERTKGILNFLQTVRPLVPRHAKILIAGEGPDRKQIETWLAHAGCDAVRLLGQQSEGNMLELFALADVLLLPSLADPNPLSVIEGLWAGLPVLVSNRCGNWPEAVEERKNGWVVDPASRLSMSAAFADMVAMSPAQMTDLGLASAHLARRRFASKPAASAFADALTAFTEAK